MVVVLMVPVGAPTPVSTQLDTCLPPSDRSICASCRDSQRFSCLRKPLAVGGPQQSWLGKAPLGLSPSGHLWNGCCQPQGTAYHTHLCARGPYPATVDKHTLLPSLAPGWGLEEVVALGMV